MASSAGRRKQVEQGKHPSLAQRVQNLIHAWDGQLAEAADLVEFLVVDSDPNASRLLRDDHQRARIRRSRVLDQACRQVLVQGGVDFLGQNWADPMGPGSDEWYNLASPPLATVMALPWVFALPSTRFRCAPRPPSR